MNINKGLTILIVAIAVIGAFVEIPMAHLALLIVGIASGIASPLDNVSDRTGYLIFAFAGPEIANHLDLVPEVGAYLNSMVDAVALGAGGIWLASATRSLITKILP